VRFDLSSGLKFEVIAWLVETLHCDGSRQSMLWAASCGPPAIWSEDRIICARFAATDGVNVGSPTEELCSVPLCLQVSAFPCAPVLGVLVIGRHLRRLSFQVPIEEKSPSAAQVPYRTAMRGPRHSSSQHSQARRRHRRPRHAPGPVDARLCRTPGPLGARIISARSDGCIVSPESPAQARSREMT
jgi:hypothetical protein